MTFLTTDLIMFISNVTDSLHIYLLPPVCPVRREVMFSVCPLLGGASPQPGPGPDRGVPQPSPSPGRGTPLPSQRWGTPWPGMGYSPASNRVTPPSQAWVTPLPLGQQKEYSLRSGRYILGSHRRTFFFFDFFIVL